MGDIADYLIEEGKDAYFAHLAGTCEYDCIYCMQEDSPPQTKGEGK